MDANAMLFFDKQKKLERLISFINESMKSGNDVYLSWKKLPDRLDLAEWHLLHDNDDIAEVQGYYHDGIVVEMADYRCNQVSSFRLLSDRNDFHLYEVITIDDRYHSYSKIATEVCVNTCIMNDTDIALI